MVFPGENVLNKEKFGNTVFQWRKYIVLPIDFLRDFRIMNGYHLGVKALHKPSKFENITPGPTSGGSCVNTRITG